MVQNLRVCVGFQKEEENRRKMEKIDKFTKKQVWSQKLVLALPREFQFRIRLNFRGASTMMRDTKVSMRDMGQFCSKFPKNAN
jgi:hypothetical protein